MPNKPNELQKAEDLLKQFEWSSDYSEKFRCFAEAMSIFKKFVSTPNVSAQNQEWIENIKLAYTRRFLEQLSEIPQNEGVNFLFLLFRYVPKEIKKITKTDAALAEKYDDFCRYFIDDLSDLIQRELRNRK